MDEVMAIELEINGIVIEEKEDFLIDFGVFAVNELRKSGENGELIGGTAKQDLENINRWLGHVSGEYTVRCLDKIKVGWKIYISRGIAPSLELEDSFEAYAGWLSEDVWYGSSSPTLKVFEAFDRLLATPNEIQAKEKSDRLSVQSSDRLTAGEPLSDKVKSFYLFLLKIFLSSIPFILVMLNDYQRSSKGEVAEQLYNNMWALSLGWAVTTAVVYVAFKIGFNLCTIGFKFSLKILKDNWSDSQFRLLVFVCGSWIISVYLVDFIVWDSYRSYDFFQLPILKLALLPALAAFLFAYIFRKFIK